MFEANSTPDLVITQLSIIKADVFNDKAYAVVCTYAGVLFQGYVHEGVPSTNDISANRVYTSPMFTTLREAVFDIVQGYEEYIIYQTIEKNGKL